MNTLSRALLAAGVCLIFGLRALALSVVPPSFEELVRKADLVAQTEVLSERAEWTGTGPNRHIVTKVKVRILECLAGEAPAEVELSFFGGFVGNEGMTVPGMPRFAEGDRDILFVRNNGRSLCPLVAAGHGRYIVVKSEKSGAFFVARGDGTPLREITDVSKALDERKARSVQVDESSFMSLESFREAVVGAAQRLGKTTARQAR